MHERGVLLNRENYISINWLGEPPEKWGAEHELDLPLPLQDGVTRPL